MRQLASATVGYTTAALAMGEMVSRLTTDVNDFLAADSDAPIPPSLRQACRLLNTPELEECAARVTSGVARAVTEAAAATMASGRGEEEDDTGAGGEGEGDGEGERRAGMPTASSSSSPQAVVDRILDRVLDTSNWGLVSCIVSSTARQSLEAVIDVMKEQYAAQQQGQQQGGEGTGGGGGGGREGAASTATSSTVNDVILPWLDRQPERVLSLAASAEGKSVLLDLCSCFVSNAVGVYLEKTAGSNTFDDFFNAATRAGNREVMQDIAGRVTGEAVRTAVEVMTPGGAPATASRRAARTAAARASQSQRGEERRRREIVFQTPAPVPAMVGGVAEGGEASEAGGGAGGVRVGERGGGRHDVGGDMYEEEELMITPGSVESNGFVSQDNDAAMSISEEDLPIPPDDDDRPLAASTSSSDDTAREEALHPTVRARDSARTEASSSAAASSAAAAAFTAAMLNEVAPHLFRVVVAPEGRQLITEVAGTCTASAVRSFVLSLRDCVFLVNGTKAGAGGGGEWSGRSVLSATNAGRVAVVAWLLFYLLPVAFMFMCASLHNATRYFLTPVT